MDPNDLKEIKRRRTFAIISHPDAGKTTITEKLLLYGGAIHEAGEVQAKKQRRSARSDWMQLEQERGISISTSVMQFEYNNFKINLLDTPGHADFSEDTYRTLSAVDSAVMVLDNAKGVESQTRKLFEVCRLRNTPIFSFINKLDREGRSPFELMEEIEKVLNIECNPITWPIGMGKSFHGVYHRLTKKIILFEQEGFASKEAKEIEISSLYDEQLSTILGEAQHVTLLEEIELVESTLGEFNQERFLEAKVTPVFFGSARTNFGINPFLKFFCDHAPQPRPMHSNQGDIVPDSDFFSGFVFKIQANMDKQHRDRIAFMRIASGVFERGMYAYHTRSERELRLAYPQQFLAKDRNIIEKAYAGDIIGLHDTGNCIIGDTLTTGPKNLKFDKIPQFSPEFFAKIVLKDPLKRKQLKKGIDQLCEEGTVQLFINPFVGEQEPTLGAVGMLQFEVFLFRLKDEYGVEADLQAQPYKIARWIRYKDNRKEKPTYVQGSMTLLSDRLGNPVGLFTNEFNLNWVIENNPELVFLNNFQN